MVEGARQGHPSDTHHPSPLHPCAVVGLPAGHRPAILHQQAPPQQEVRVT